MSPIQSRTQKRWIGTPQYPTWRSIQAPNARTLFCLYYRQIFDHQDQMSPDAMRYCHRLWLHTREKQKWQMLEALVSLIHTIQAKEGMPLVHPCVILHSACQILNVVPPADYLVHYMEEPEPLQIDLPILFKHLVLDMKFMGEVGKYILRYYLSVYFATMLGIQSNEVATYGCMPFIDRISAIRSRSMRSYFLQLGRDVLWR
uniref:Mating-type protein MAT1-2-7 n=1 Tax=Thielaviopsis punctulata TaxID=72032 RepID=A0A2R4ZT45_9PEZI|nr:TPA_exp: mating-type protein MAT1-2-7 [Thielaviopsis punctulata]